ncbi:hypothetical protein BGW38_004779, partial [Lunasporangiospora selenospora]
MRISVSTVILSLAAATSVYAAPAMPVNHLEKRGWVLDQLKPIFEKVVKSLECGACVTALSASKSIAYMNRKWVLDAANGICSDFKIMPKDVCSGLVYSQGPVLIEAVMQARILSGDGKLICHQ